MTSLLKLCEFVRAQVVFWLWSQSGPYIITATSYIIWALFTGLVIYTILTICARTREEAYESALIVHKILQNKPIFMLNDEIYYNKMKSFTLQILHRKNTFNFNGLGLFNLDYTFIFSVRFRLLFYLKFYSFLKFFLFLCRLLVQQHHISLCCCNLIFLKN